ncbi:MAG: anti-anti-sigma factor [Alteromonadaceae bacterium]|jgi:anti-anti-sigma factor
MTVKKRVSEDLKSVSISIEGRFDFSLHKQFRDAYSSDNTNGTRFNLDLSKATYMDSSALGMILLLKDHVEKLKGEVVVSNPSESVKKILEIAQIHKLMTIEG